MSDGRNLGIGILLGMLLTGGLMFALYQQSGLAGAERKATAERAAGVLPDASAVFAPLQKSRAPASLSPQSMLPNRTLSGVEGRSDGTGTSVVTPSIGVLGGESVPSAELVSALPAGLDFSPTALDELSAAERVQYETMVQSYREVRTKVLALDQERAELKRRMDVMFEQNEVMEQEVKRMRAVLEQLPEND